MLQVTVYQQHTYQHFAFKQLWYCSLNTGTFHFALHVVQQLEVKQLSIQVQLPLQTK